MVVQKWMMFLGALTIFDFALYMLTHPQKFKKTIFYARWLHGKNKMQQIG